MEKNKIFAAILCAGIAAMLSGFIANKLIHPHELAEDAIPIEGVEMVAGGGAGKPQMPDPIMDLIATADIAKGEKLSKACAACHTFDKGGTDKVGPNLWGAAGGPKGGKAGFAYSAGMSAKGGAWGYEDLNWFLWKPKAFVDGTKMNFAGLKKAEDRAALIAWLRTQGGSLGMPSDADIAKEAADLAPPVVEEPAEAAAEEAVEAAVPAAEEPEAP